MSRYRRYPRAGTGDISQQDTGKDLFALLFLVMLMQSLLFMIFANESASLNSIQPVSESSGGSNGTDPEKIVVGKVFQKGNRLFLNFEGNIFDPKKDGAGLVTKGYTVTTHDSSGRETQAVYVDYEGVIDSKILSDSLAPLQNMGIVPLFP